MLDPDAGHFAIAPVEPFTATRRYLDGTLVLETTLRTATATFRLVDALALAPADAHAFGRAPICELVRTIECRTGSGAIAVDLIPRFDYARASHEVRAVGPDLEFQSEHGERLRLRSERPPATKGGGTVFEFPMTAGERASFVLGDDVARAPVEALLEDTMTTWRAWTDAHQAYLGLYQDAVHHSARVLQALTYQPEGSVLAAPTTSLPEIVGKDWNWDYRYAWLRDASFVANALRIGACTDEAARYFGWMESVEHGDELQIVYGIDGRRDLTEELLHHLEGFAGSRPVRVGNEAWHQRQLDVPGEIVDAAWQVREQLDLRAVGSFVTRLADRAASSWREPDSGIWEGREGERHNVSSKLFCWVALDRAIRMAGSIGGDVTRWRTDRDALHAAILRDGWSEQRAAYTGAFGSDHLDASVLLLPLVGFLRADDERMQRTIAAIEAELTENDMVRRWTGGEDEGSFVMCTCWLAQCHAAAGNVERARAIFESVLSHRNDVGLLAEMIDPATGEQLGNFPQALSHAALIGTANDINRGAQSAKEE